jgi:Na+/melibiose symporter-like transporter
MDDKPSFRFCFAGGATMIVLMLVFWMFIALAASADHNRSVLEMIGEYCTIIIAPVLGVLGCAAGVLFGIDWVNRRDSHGPGKRPPDDP